MRARTQLATLIVVLACAATAAAQAPKANLSSAPPAQPTFRHGGRIVAGKDKTELGYMPIFNDGVDRNLFLYAKFDRATVYPGLRPTNIFFLSISTGPKYTHALSLSMEVDDDRYVFGSTDIDLYAQRKGDYVVEGVGVTLSHSSLVSLANAKKVTVHLGATDFELSRDHLAALRDMADRSAK
jgi:hypothetical protein